MSRLSPSTNDCFVHSHACYTRRAETDEKTSNLKFHVRRVRAKSFHPSHGNWAFGLEMVFTLNQSWQLEKSGLGFESQNTISLQLLVIESSWDS
jgi:hypothetical protein